MLILRERKSTREIPLLFAGGEGEALEKTKAKVPSATYVSVARLDAALNRLAKKLEG